MSAEPKREIEGLTTRQLTARAVAVERLAKWMMSNPEENTSRRPVRQLPPESGSRDGPKKYFTQDRTYGDVWGGICQAVRDHLLSLNPPVEPHPDIKWYAERYERLRPTPPEPDRPKVETAVVQSQFATWTEPQLRKAINDDDLTLAVAAARFLVDGLAETMRTPSAAGSSRAAVGGEAGSKAKQALLAATAIIKVGVALRKRVSELSGNPSTQAQVTDHILRECVPIFEATADAYRLRSRVPRNENSQLFELEEFRRQELLLTERVRTPVDLVITKYHGEAVAAVLRQDHAAAEVEAVAKMLRDLHALFSGPDGDSHRAQADVDPMLAAVARLASYAVAYPEYIPELRTSADHALGLFRPGVSRNEVHILLDQAGLRRHQTEVPSPTQVLQLARYRGVGDLFVARAMERIGNSTATTLSGRNNQQMFLGDLSEDEPNRAVALQRAVTYYQRAVAWLKRSGAAGEVRTIAKEECAELLKDLTRLESSATVGGELGDGSRQTADDAPLKRIRADVDRAIGESIMQSGFADPGNQARGSAGRLIRSLRQVFLVLDDRYATGLRTDLPPVSSGPANDDGLATR